MSISRKRKIERVIKTFEIHFGSAKDVTEKTGIFQRFKKISKDHRIALAKETMSNQIKSLGLLADARKPFVA